MKKSIHHMALMVKFLEKDNSSNCAKTFRVCQPFYLESESENEEEGGTQLLQMP